LGSRGVSASRIKLAVAKALSAALAVSETTPAAKPAPLGKPAVVELSFSVS